MVVKQTIRQKKTPAISKVPSYLQLNIHGNQIFIRESDFWVNAAHILKAEEKPIQDDIRSSGLLQPGKFEVVRRSDPLIQETYIDVPTAFKICEKYELNTVKESLRMFLNDLNQLLYPDSTEYRPTILKYASTETQEDRPRDLNISSEDGSSSYNTESSPVANIDHNINSRPESPHSNNEPTVTTQIRGSSKAETTLLPPTSEDAAAYN
jgi:hypothetical protein